MRTLLALLFVASAAVAAPPQSTLPPRGTGVPEFDRMIADARQRGNAVERVIWEDWTAAAWVFRASPDGYVEKVRRVDPVRRQATSVVLAPAPVREVRAPEVFREQLSRVRIPGFAMECEYDPDHVCNKCGRVQLVIDHWNRDGTHTHVCSRCRHSWRHRN